MPKDCIPAAGRGMERTAEGEGADCTAVGTIQEMIGGGGVRRRTGCGTYSMLLSSRISLPIWPLRGGLGSGDAEGEASGLSKGTMAMR